MEQAIFLCKAKVIIATTASAAVFATATRLTKT